MMPEKRGRSTRYQASTKGLIADEMTAQAKNPLFPAMNFGKRAALQAKVTKLTAPNIKESQHEPCIVDP